MRLLKQSKQFTHKTFRQFTQVYTEADIIVPDVKPDIMRILHCDAIAHITDKNIVNDKLIFEGESAITILYLADGDKSGDLRSVSVHHHFKHAMDFKVTEEGILPENMQIDADLQVQNVDFVLVNSRKFCAKILMGLEVSLIAKQDIEACIGLASDTTPEGQPGEGQQIVGRSLTDEDLQKKFSTMNANYRHIVAERDLVARDVLEVPVGKSAIGEVLRVDAKVSNSDSKAAGDKVLLKGDVLVNVLYIGEDGELNCMEHAVPYSEIVSVNEEIMDDSRCVIACAVTNMAYNPQQDSDGDVRLLGVDIGLHAILRMDHKVSLDVLDDVYSTRRDLEAQRNKVRLTRMVDCVSGTLTISDSIQSDVPHITQVYNVIARPQITSGRIEGSKIMVEGIVDADVIFITGSADLPICAVRREIKFAHSFETGSPHSDAGLDCDIHVELQHMSYALGLNGDVDLRGVLSIEVQVLKTCDQIYVSDIIEKESQDDRTDSKPYYLRVYYAKEGDTVWSIAKKYRIKVDDLVDRNGEEMTAGKRLVLQG